MQLKVTAKDGYQLGATAFQPESDATKGVLLVCSAMGVLQSYYSKYATYMASQGYIVYTFDYRGIGRSAPESLKGFEASLHQWGALDITAMIDHIVEAHPTQKLFVATHSVGGQILGMSPQNHLVSGIVMVASQSGYWNMWSGIGKLKMLAIWYGFIPGLSKLTGYLPAKKLRMFEDLPKGVAEEWAQWGRHKDYMMGYWSEKEPMYAQVDCPMISYSIDDDKFAPRKAVSWMSTRYRNADLQLKHVKPSDLKVGSIGHFGFFRAKFQQSFWLETVGFFDRLSNKTTTTLHEQQAAKTA
ncbi:MAG: alpha/beta fold hydrolase [Aureispira sp.]|nr:alpha/beta fold hydrolase [Aureispira sp.]